MHVARPEHVGHAPHHVLVTPRPIESQRFDLVDCEPRVRGGRHESVVCPAGLAQPEVLPRRETDCRKSCFRRDAHALVELDVVQAVLAEDEVVRAEPQIDGTSM